MTDRPKYISCIKLHGKPLLSPLMTEERREECRMYKARAMACEKKLDRNRFLTQCTHDLENLEKRTENMRMKASLESQLAFNSIPKTSSLTRETIDVSEYSNDGVKVITKCSNAPTPKLIRSNSYTLDTPSPILLAHLEREAQKCISNTEYSDSSHELDITETDITIKSITLSTSRNDDIFDNDFSEILQNLPQDTAKTIIDIFEKSPESQTNFGYINNNERDKIQWAAHKIGAWAKGYLVRRLMQTDRIQNLIETIKDALVCAIQMHSAEVIEEADVELHRRLIQQVSAACYAFHDIFFKLPAKERMSIIAADRAKRLEKIKKSRETMTHMIHADDSQIAR